MPKETSAVTCEQCKKMHPVTGSYIIVSATILEHKDASNNTYEYKKRDIELVNVNDAIVCNNRCLSELLALKGF